MAVQMTEAEQPKTASPVVEPLLAGDRQREKRVAATHNPLPSEAFEVSLS
jgi:hypothetical protein